MKLVWHKPRVVTVEAWAPFRSGAMFTLYDGRTLFFRSIPIVVNSGDVEAKALAEKRKAREREQNRKRQANYQQRKRDAMKHKRGKPDPLRATTVWLPESEIEEPLADVDLAPLGRPLTSKELREIKSRVITEAARRGLRNKK